MTTSRTIAHLSDLHLDLSPERYDAATAIRDRLRALPVDHVVVTGDVTHRGRPDEYWQFRDLFAEFFDSGRLTVLPGNHDRWRSGISTEMTGGRRVRITGSEGIHVVAVDTTRPHNWFSFLGHGAIDRQMMGEVERAVAAADPSDAVVVAMHHHPIPQPEEMILEKLARFFGTPIAAELRHGRELIARLAGRCDLVLHGHRHVPMETIIPHQARPLGVYNAGSSTMLGRFRLFRFEGATQVSKPEWVACG